MPLGSWLRSAVGGLLVDKAKRPKGDPRRTFTSGAPVAGPNLNAWTDSRLDQVKAFKHWVYVATDLIAGKVACQFPNVGHVRPLAGDPAKWALSPYHRRKALTPLYGQDDLVRADHHHPLVRLLQSPNDWDTSFDLWYETVMFLCLTGSAYWWVAPNKVTGLPAAIWVLPSHWTWPVFDRDGAVTDYDLRPAEGNYLRRRFPADEVIHFKWKSAISKVDGYSKLTAASQWVDTQTAMERSRWFTFKNGAFPSAALEFDPQYIDPTEADLDRIEAKFVARYAGEVRSGRPLLLPPGVKFHKLSVLPREMDYGKSADQIRDNILSVFHVPAVIAGIVAEANGQAVHAANSLFYAHAINPLCRMLGQKATERFGRDYDDPSLRAWWDDMTPDDPAEVEARLKTDLDSMAVSPNEIRLLRGRKPYEFGGWDPFMPHVGLIMPWATGEDARAVNPFSRELGLDKGPDDAPGSPDPAGSETPKKKKPAADLETDLEDEPLSE